MMHNTTVGNPSRTQMCSIYIVLGTNGPFKTIKIYNY